MKGLGVWGAIGTALVLSPVVLILGLPMLVGLGFDLLDAGGETAVVLLLCLPVAIALLRWLAVGPAIRRGAGRLCGRLHLGHAARVSHAP